MAKPAVAIGDPAGIGPEIALRAALDGGVRERCRATLGYAAAVDLVRDGKVDAVAAGPRTQRSIAAAGIVFDGYPGFVARRTGTDPGDVFMMLHTDTLRIGHTTLHVTVRTALEQIDTDRVVRRSRARRARGSTRTARSGPTPCCPTAASMPMS